MKQLIAVIMVASALVSGGCSSDTTDYYQTKVPLKSSGYGFEIGDVVLIDVEKNPVPGDLVLYDADLNDSYCTAFGPGVHIARIIGRPGDLVVFGKYSYEAPVYRDEMSSQGPARPKVIWGAELYDDVTDMALRVPYREFLAEDWIGYECVQTDLDGHDSQLYNRYTVRQGVIIGVILGKVGHDEEFEKHWANAVY